MSCPAQAEGLVNMDILAPYLFILCQDYVLWISIDLLKENGFTLKKARNRQYPTETDADYANIPGLLTNTSV